MQLNQSSSWFPFPLVFSKVETFVFFQRNPVPKSRRGGSAEGADGGEEEPACQWHRDPVLHLPLRQRPRPCPWGPERLHQQDYVSVMEVKNEPQTFYKSSWMLLWFLLLSPERRLRPSSPTPRRLWTWNHVLGNPPLLSDEWVFLMARP